MRGSAAGGDLLSAGPAGEGRWRVGVLPHRPGAHARTHTHAGKPAGHSPCHRRLVERRGIVIG